MGVEGDGEREECREGYGGLVELERARNVVPFADRLGSNRIR